MNLKMLLFASVSLVLFASCHNSDEPYMTLATKTLDVEAEGGLFTVDLSSNVYYRVNNDCQTDGSLQSKSLKIHRLVHVSVPFVSLAMM